MITSTSVVSWGRDRFRRGLGIAVFALLFAPAITSTRLIGAQPFSAPSSPSYVIEESTTHVRVQDDGSGRRRVHAKIKVADQAGVAEWSTLQFTYMSAIEDVVIEQLVVEKPDGRQVKASSLALEDAPAPADVRARAAELSKIPWTSNEVAWALAEKGVKLDVAEQYVRKAIDGVAARLQNVTLDPLVAAQVSGASDQSHCWDTLGWIYFKSGDLVQAERWVRAAWMLSQDAPLGEHLAAIYEKQGNRARAIELYAQAAGVGFAPSSIGIASEPSRAALIRLVGAEQAERQIALAKTAVVEQRMVKLPRLVSGLAQAEVTLLMAADGRITQMRFIKGDERLRAPIATLKGLKAPALQPDAQGMTFVRHGGIGCTPGGCMLVLMRPADSPRADAQ